MSSIAKRIISIAIVVLALIAMLISAIDADNTKKITEKQNIDNTKIIASTTEASNNSAEVVSKDAGEKEEEHNTLEYIVDVISINNSMLYCDTATLKGYSGKINIDISGLSNDTKVETNKTYSVVTKSIMIISDTPTVYAVSIEEATDEQIKELDNIRSKISNYNECMLDYNGMSAIDIINNANEQYVYWSQEQRKSFIEYANTLDLKDGTGNLIKIIVYDNNNKVDTDSLVE